MAKSKKGLTKKQLRLINEIMERENPQRKVDEIVDKTKLALDICKRESIQTKVDEIVAEELAKL